MSLMDQPMLLLAWVIAIFIVLSIHEFAHAWAGTLLGDNTAKLSGRLTLNPLSHVSWLGFVMLLLVGFGWGKPVPFNPYNLKYKRFGPAIVAVAGPLSNLILAIICGIALKFIALNGVVPPENLLIQFLNLMVVLNIILMIFNLLPVPPLDGSKILFSFFSGVKYAPMRQVLENQGPFILMLIIIFDNFFNVNILSGLFHWVIDFVYKLIF